MMRHGSLFSGIGGFDMAAEWMGWDNVFHCEWNPFGQQVLKHYWPGAISYDDITKTDFTIHRGHIDVLSGGFPCQPYSAAGKRLGKADDRHLWPEMLRSIREIQPAWVVGENVRGLVNWNRGMVFDEVQADLEDQGYEVLPVILPACGVGAPHRRDRVWFVAYRANSRSDGLCGRENETNKHYSTSDASSQRRQQVTRSAFSNEGADEGRCPYSNYQPECDEQSRATPYAQDVRLQPSRPARSGRARPSDGRCDADRVDTDAHLQRQQEFDHAGIAKHTRRADRHFRASEDWTNFPTQPPVCSRNDGVPAGLDGITFSKWRNESIKAYGNAVVPQLVYQIFRSIELLD